MRICPARIRTESGRKQNPPSETSMVQVLVEIRHPLAGRTGSLRHPTPPGHRQHNSGTDEIANSHTGFLFSLSNSLCRRFRALDPFKGVVFSA